MNDMSLNVPFSERIARLQRRIEYRRALTSADRDEIFQLRYRGYLRDGGIGPNETKRFTDPWDDVENALVYGVYVDGALASTVRMHIARPDGGDMPARHTFGDVVEPILATGKSIIDPTRFVIDEKFAAIGPEIPILTLRLVAMAAEHFGVETILATVRQEHGVMYRRLCGHKAISEPRTYPLLAKAIVCLSVDLPEMSQHMYGRQLFTKASQEELAQVFAGCDHLIKRAA